MKRFIAISLLLLYSGFLTGVVFHQFSFSDAETFSAYHATGNDVEDELSSNAELNAVKFTANHKHVAANIKAKIVRANAVSVDLRNAFSSNRLSSFHPSSSINSSPRFYVPVIIKNCVFRI